MYRAKIESVSGGKVYADGKWLICIGNKNFRSGDLVWTDGRCAYGNYQESQQPQVITAPDDTGIPIAYNNTTVASFIKRKEKIIGTLYEDGKFSPTISQPLSTYPPLSRRDALMINDKKGRVFISDNPFILAANIDNSGNQFFIVCEESENIEDFSNWDYGDDIAIKIVKNGVVVDKIFLDRIDEKIRSLIPNGSYFPEEGDEIERIEPEIQYCLCNAFIENESSWACFIRVSISCGFRHYFPLDDQQVMYTFTPTDYDGLIFYMQHNVPLLFGSETMLNSLMANRPVKFSINIADNPYDAVYINFAGGVCTLTGSAKICGWAIRILKLGYDPEFYPEDKIKGETFNIYVNYYMLPKEEHIFQVYTVGEYDNYYTTEILDDIYASVLDFNVFLRNNNLRDIEEVKIPMPDNYYYRQIHEPTFFDTHNPDRSWLKFIWKIFSPADKEIVALGISGGGLNDQLPHILISKLKNGNYLFRFDVAVYEIDDIHEQNPIAGLCIYDVKNKVWERLEEDKKISSVSINQRLRPMEKIKNWHKRIKEIKLDLDENQDDNSAD